MDVKVRRRVVINCPHCNHKGMESHSMYHNDVKWEECSVCGGSSRLEQWAEYWVPLRSNGTVPDPEDKGIEPVNIHQDYELVE